MNLGFRSPPLWASSCSDQKGVRLIQQCHGVWSQWGYAATHRHRVEASQHHTGQGLVRRSDLVEHTHLLLFFFMIETSKHGLIKSNESTSPKSI